MNLRKLTGCLILFFTLTACANTTGETNALLWKISGNGLEFPSYLFGTHHLVPLSFLDSIIGLEEAFEATEQTVGELDMSKMSEMQIKIMGAAIMPNEYDYRTLISEADFQLLDKTLKELTGSAWQNETGHAEQFDFRLFISEILPCSIREHKHRSALPGRSGQAFPSRTLFGNGRRTNSPIVGHANHRKAGRTAYLHGESSRDTERANGQVANGVHGSGH